jgi:dynein heavy chain 2
MSSDDYKEKALVFYKVRPETITPDNIQTTVFISSVLGSPLTTFYQSVHNVYIPMLLKDDKQSLDPKFQSLLGELDAGLGSIVRRQADQSGSAKNHVADDSIGGKQFCYALPHSIAVFFASFI